MQSVAGLRSGRYYPAKVRNLLVFPRHRQLADFTGHSIARRLRRQPTVGSDDRKRAIGGATRGDFAFDVACAYDERRRQSPVAVPAAVAARQQVQSALHSVD
jgi:hypothetical protein